MDLKFKILPQKDIPQAIELAAACFGPEWRTITREEFDIVNSNDYYRPVFYAAYQKEKLVAMASTMATGCQIRLRSISWVCVNPPLQGQGIGHKLMEFLLEQIDATYFKGEPGAVLLTVKKETAPFYQKLGFKGDAPVHDGNILMAKRIG